MLQTGFLQTGSITSSAMWVIKLGEKDTHQRSEAKEGKPIPANFPLDQYQHKTTNKLKPATIPVDRKERVSKKWQ